MVSGVTGGRGRETPAEGNDMQATDFGLAFLLLIVLAFYLFRHYSMISRVWMACASCLLFASMTALTFVVAWLL